MKLTINIFFLAGLAAAQDSAGMAQGRMIVNEKEHLLKFSRAATVPDDQEKGKEMLRVVISDAPFPAKTMFDDSDLIDLAHDGKIHGIQLDFHEEGVVVMFRTTDVRGSYSQSRTPNPFVLKNINGRVEGEVVTAEKGEGNSPSFDVSVKFSAPIVKYVLEAEPTAADEEAAKKSAAARAYLDLMDAIAKGDKDRILAAAPPDNRAKIDTPQFPEMLKMIQEMEPKEIRVRRAVEKDGDATLWVAGKQDGNAINGEISMRLVQGKWVMRAEKWHNQ